MDQSSIQTRGLVLDSVAIFLLAAALIWPLFKVKYTDRWDSIESTFIADARFLRDHWPHPRWQPLWYCGTRFDYIYPPALRYGTAALTKIYPALLPVRAYHIYTAFFYCVGIAGVYLFVRVASGSRAAAWLAAAGAALLGPCYLFMPDYRHDALRLAPQRLWALYRYGEGPHMSAFAYMPIALAASLRALQGSHRSLALAAVFCALVVSHNFYGATALALLFSILVWSLWVAHQDARIWLRALGVAALAYGLTAFWLAPSYVRITVANLKFVAEPGNTRSSLIVLAAAALFALLTYRFARDRRELAYPVFVWGASAGLTLLVLGNYYFQLRPTGEPLRLIPEMDLAIILMAIEGLRLLWRRRWWVARICAAALVVAAFSTSRHFVRRAWQMYGRDPNPQDRIEYRLTAWMAKNLPEARAVATGSVRFWYNAWYDLPQIDGGSDQGVLNQLVMPAQLQVLNSPKPEPSVQWLQCLGVDALIVHDKTSEELFHDYKYPEKFAGLLPLLWSDGKGNFIYQIPRRFPGLARVVDRKRVESLRPLRVEDDVENLQAYADAVERGPDSPARTMWEGSDALRVEARLQPSEQILLQMSYDPAWHAYSSGRPLPIRKDILNQILIEAPPGEHNIRLVFELPLENLVGRIVSVLSAGVVLALLWRSARQPKEINS